MKTTVNLPDELIKEAKKRAIDEGRTLTDLLVEGLKGRIQRNIPARKLPVSSTAGGLVPGADWENLRAVDPQGESYR
jgi:hypothetical protein